MICKALLKHNKNSMAPPKWTSVEQEAWLQPWYEKFKVKQSEKHKNYKNFFADLNEQWFEEFPEPRPSHITQVGPLTLIEEAEMGVACDARKAVSIGPLGNEQTTQLIHATKKLSTRFKNSLGSSKTGRKAKADTTNVIDAVIRSITECEKPTRMLQEQEAYSKLFYTTRVQPTVKESLKAVQEHRTLTNGERVALVKKETAALYAQESPDIKDQVKQYLEDEKQRKLQIKQDGRSQVSDYSRNLDKLAAVANSFLKGLAEATGMSFSLLAGGPSPEAHGAIDVYSFHIGQTKLGNNFNTAYPGFDVSVMEPFRDFLHRVHPEAGVSTPQEGSSEISGDTGGLSTPLDATDLDLYESGNDLLSFLDVSSGTNSGVPDTLSMEDTSLWSDVQSAQPALDQLPSQSHVLPESATTPLLPSYSDTYMPPDLDAFLAQLEVQLALEPGASETETTTLPPMSTLHSASPLTTTASTSIPPPDTTGNLSILPAVSHTPQPVGTLTSELPPASTTGSLNVDPLAHASTTGSLDGDPLAPTSGSECLDDIGVNTEKDGPALETRRTKRIPKPSTRNDTANAIGGSRKENKRPADTSSDHGPKRTKV
ncbi:hypothetical protein DEU56DRAFT_76751 [Suillus clintonianus]|uniref:uncharacterized protein n=1 Tax=Suillus clintonianus TaxID=1904413 RepID=UPI001B86051D|nr:uncharacterized protein DEU56DRAFT_76751 [Suillus clintonianus]KAG2122217.1 hypothetical protein DEU56DRAFT_76751 [Suillus clintonianus]